MSARGCECRKAGSPAAIRPSPSRLLCAVVRTRERLDQLEDARRVLLDGATGDVDHAPTARAEQPHRFVEFAPRSPRRWRTGWKTRCASSGRGRAASRSGARRRRPDRTPCADSRSKSCARRFDARHQRHVAGLVAALREIHRERRLRGARHARQHDVGAVQGVEIRAVVVPHRELHGLDALEVGVREAVQQSRFEARLGVQVLRRCSRSAARAGRRREPRAMRRDRAAPGRPRGSPP